MKKHSPGVIIDGFVRSTALGGSSQKVHKIKEASNLAGGRSRFKAAAQSVHKKTQRSQTLMRSAVRKPQLSKNVESRTLVQSKARTASLSPARITRAQSVTKSSKVKRFGHVPFRSRSQAKNTSVNSQKKQPAAAAAKPKTEVARPVPSMVTSVSHHQLERLLDQALLRADAHKKALDGKLPNRSFWQRIKNTPRWLSVGASVLIVALLTGFYAWQNIPQVAVKVAASRAKVNASVPEYVPPGFSFAGPVEYSNGAVTIKFKANDSGGREFALTQKKSDLSNKSLVDSTIPKNTQTQTAQVGGTTIYIYGNNNDAVWVNKGVQYKLKDAAKLNSDQILKIADSL